jgi:cobalt-zinc-cadmium efflux system outer membrane protein
MKRFLIVLSLVASGCAGSAPPPVEEPAPSPAPLIEARPEPVGSLTLDEALKIAEGGHPELAEARARADAARGRARQGGAWPDPALVGRVEAAGSDDREEYLAGVSQAFPIGGRLGAARRAEELDAERFDLELESRRRHVLGKVQATFAAALYSDRALALLNEASADAGRAVAVAQSLATSGEGLPIDVSRARIERLRVILERDRTESLSKEARLALVAAIGRPGLEIGTLEGSLERAIELPTLESLVSRLGDHPAMRAARAGVLAHEARIDAAEARRIPDINLDLLYHRLEETRENTFDVGVSLTLPLFDRNRGSIREAKADRRAAQARAEMSSIELARELEQAHVKLARALAAAKTIKEELVVRYDEIARSYEARYTAGDASLSDLLPVRRERIAARMYYLEALRDVMEAWAQLMPFLQP